jgi:hypothetical protein
MGMPGLQALHVKVSKPAVPQDKVVRRHENMGHALSPRRVLKLWLVGQEVDTISGGL